MFNYCNEPDHTILKDMKRLLIILTLISSIIICNNVIGKTSNANKPNVLFISIDDMNDWTGFLGGHPQAITPNMDELAKKGVNFTNAHTVVPGCSPSRNALMFGVEPYESGLYPFYQGAATNILHKKYISLARLFKENGYNSYGAGKIHPGGGTSIPWTEYSKYDRRKSFRPVLMKELGYYDERRKSAYCPTANPYSEHPDFITASYGINMLKRKHDKPFFLGVGFIKPHLPFVCPKEFFDALPEKILPPPIKIDDHNDIPWAGRAFTKIKDEYQYRKDGAWNAVRRSYLACISWTDYNVGRVLSALEKSPYADNTIIVLWSDHGFHQGDKRSFSKFSLWEESTRVPFIIYDPRHENYKGDCSEPVSLLYIYRTLTDMTGLETPDYVMGNSLVPQMKNVKKAVSAPAMTTWGRGNYSLRNKDFRYTRYFDGTEEFYDHRKDPNEWENLADNPKYQNEKENIKKFLPKTETPLFMIGIKEGSVMGADNPELIDKTKRDWAEYKDKINPPLAE